MDRAGDIRGGLLFASKARNVIDVQTGERIPNPFL
jgi:hypothetical protein